MRIIFIIHSLERGGAERVVTTMANYWAAAGHEVTIVTIAEQRLDAYQLREGVNRVALDLAGSGKNLFEKLANNWRRLIAVRKAVRNIAPSAVLGFTTNVNCLTILALIGTRFTKIISERMDPDAIQVGSIRSWLCKMLYPRADWLVVQTEHARRIMQSRYRSLRVAVVPNPIPPSDPDQNLEHMPVRSMLGLPDETRLVAGMGRLGPEKGFDLLIKAFCGIAQQFPDWHLVIFGEGGDRWKLEHQISASNCAHRIHLTGAIRTPRKSLAECGLFVLSSRHEGFPNVLLEAMASGLPVISFNCLSGPGEIIRNEHDGLLVDAADFDQLGAVIAGLLRSPDTRLKLAKNATKVIDRFSPEKIMGLWDQIINESERLK